MPHEQRHVFADVAVGAGEPPPALVTEDGRVQGRDTRYERAFLLPSCREIDRSVQANLPQFVRLRNTIDFPAVNDEIRIRRVDRQFDRDPGDPGRPARVGLDGSNHALRGRVPEIFVQDVRHPSIWAPNGSAMNRPRSGGLSQRTRFSPWASRNLWMGTSATPMHHSS